MMKDTKRRLMTFTFYDRTGIVKDLEKQAAQGWMLEKCSASGWVYRRIEPADIHFSVVYFPAADPFDPHPSEDQLRFREFCEHTGWELVASNVQMQIFCNRRADPIPIETDPAIEVANIHASVKKTLFPGFATNVVLALMQIGLALQRYSLDPIGELSSMYPLVTMLFWVMMLFSCTAQIFFYFRWYFRAKAAALDGQFLETRSTDRFQITMLASSCLAIVFMFLSLGGVRMMLVAVLLTALLIVVSLLSVRLTNFLKEKNVSAKTNRLATYALMIPLSLLICGLVIWLMVSIRMDDSTRREGAETYEYNGWTYSVYHDPIPLKIEDLLDTDYGGYSYEVLSDVASPLLRRYEARQRTRYDALAEPEMHYHVLEVRVPFLYDWVLNIMEEEFDHGYARPEEGSGWEAHVAIDPEPWGAIRACQLYLGGEAQDRYLLCYERHIIEIDLDWTPSEQEMAVIAEKLLSLD